MSKFIRLAVPRWVSVAVLSIAAACGLYVLDTRTRPEVVAPPTILIVIVDPASPAFYLKDDSDGIAQNVKYWFALVDDSRPSQGLPFTPIPIPSAGSDFIRPHESNGPMSVFLPYASQIAKGDHISGYIAATCQNCDRNRYVWINLNYGGEGWYAEMNKQEIESLKSPISVPAQFPNGIPISRRISVRNSWEIGM